MPGDRRVGEIRELRDFATELALEAGHVTLRYYGRVVEHQAKGDEIGRAHV